jgi:hypothetical protein
MNFLQIGQKYFSVIVILSSIAVVNYKVEAKAVKYLNYGAWEIKARFNKDGIFSRCTAETKASSESNITLGIAINRDSKLEIWFWNNRWKLDKGENYPVSFRIDRYSWFDRKLQALDATGGYIRSAGGELAFKQLRRGYNLYLKTNSAQFAFSLRGSSNALKIMRKCWDENDIGGSDAPLNSNPFSSKRSESANDSDKNSDNSPASYVVSELVLKRLTSAYRFKKLAEIPDEMKFLKPSIAWTYPGGYGLAIDVPFKMSTSSIEKSVKVKDKKECDGEFAIRSYDRSIGSKEKRPVSTVKSACINSESSADIFVVYSYYSFKRKEMIAVIHFGFEPMDSSDADGQFFQELNKIYTKYIENK